MKNHLILSLIALLFTLTACNKNLQAPSTVNSNVKHNSVTDVPLDHGSQPH